MYRMWGPLEMEEGKVGRSPRFSFVWLGWLLPCTWAIAHKSLLEIQPGVFIDGYNYPLKKLNIRMKQHYYV